MLLCTCSDSGDMDDVACDNDGDMTQMMLLVLAAAAVMT